MNRFDRKPDFHSHISLVGCEIFVSKNKKTNRTPDFLQLVSETVLSGGHLPKQLLVEGWGGGGGGGEGNRRCLKIVRDRKFRQRRAKCMEWKSGLNAHQR